MKKTYKNNRLGWTAEYVSHSDQFKITNGTKLKGYTAAELIIGSPDWVEEKYFVIKAFRGVSKLVAKFMYIQNNGGYSYLEYDPSGGIALHKVLHEDYCVDSGDFEIFSVLCNGIEWKLQDKSEQGEIVKFKILTDGTMVVETDKGIINYDINSLTPAKVILTTEDGKNIHGGEKVFYVDCDLELIEKLYPKEVTDKHIYQCQKHGKYFSTREAAESYISQNKKKYSENDIREVIEGASWCKEAKDYLITKLNEKK